MINQMTILILKYAIYPYNFYNELMDIAAIRDKYKSILEDDTPHFSDQNEEQPQWAEYLHNKRNQHRSPLNELNNPNTQTSKDKTRKPRSTKASWLGNQQIHEKNILQLKEKLAQSIANDNKKANRIKQLESELIKIEQYALMTEKTSLDLKQKIKQHEALLTQQKVKFVCLQKQNHNLCQRNEEIHVDWELLTSQIQFYKNQIESLKRQIGQKDKNFTSLTKEFDKVDCLKKENARFKDDIKRLFFLLSKHQNYSPLTIKLEGKHFLGKSSKHTKQMEYWYPDSLIGGVQQFLKRQQVGTGNKEFTQNLCKFVHGIIEKGSNMASKKTKEKIKSHIKTLQRRQNQVINVFDLPQSMVRKSETSSKIYSSCIKTRKTAQKSCKKMDKSLQCLNDSHIETGKRFKTLEKSHCLDDNDLMMLKDQFTLQGYNIKSNDKIDSLKQLCLELLDSFRKGVEKLCQSESTEKLSVKLEQLVDWLCSSVREAFTHQQASHQKIDRSRCYSMKNPTKWKTHQDF